MAGIRTPQHLTIKGKEANKSKLPAMEEVMPDVFGQLNDVRLKLGRITATCRTSSLPCKKASCSCCRPARANAQPGGLENCGGYGQ